MTTPMTSLKINNWKKIVPYIIWGIITLLLLIFIIKVSVFEAEYYNEKEGSERAIAEGVSSVEKAIEPVDETEPTEPEVREYTVPADQPRYLTISRIGVYKARIITVWVKASGELGTPNNIFDAGWYGGSGKPGQGGTLLIDGHNGGPSKIGIFKNLPAVQEGDIVEIERGDGAIFKYKVVENKSVPLSEADAYMRTAQQSPEPGKESVTIITCTGEWSDMQKTYLSRQFLRAVLVEG